MNFIYHKKSPIKIFFALLILALTVSTSVVAGGHLTDPGQVKLQIKNLNWITEEYPPFNYLDPNTGKTTGFSVELLLQIFAKIGIPSQDLDVTINPWARGYHKVMNEPGTALFTTVYTEDRLQKMKFIGPIAPNIIAVIAPKSSQLSINSAEELNRLKIGVVREDIGEQLLLKQGVNSASLDRLNSGLSMVKKLASGRIDAVGYAHATTLLLFKTAQINPDNFEIIHVLKYSAMGYTFHNSTDTKILETISQALAELSMDGTLAALQTKYGLAAVYE
ncbi:MAG: ABC transporter substrate-binding protein [Oceanospirillaceae bacterium]|nr:ABC transporter substrate-binding protein [Oceanospirillaceae bacterium]NRB42601.1 ABC transporter substrate-binding protein [Pseudomonadales bacterium]